LIGTIGSVDREKSVDSAAQWLKTTELHDIDEVFYEAHIRGGDDES